MSSESAVLIISSSDGFFVDAVHNVNNVIATPSLLKAIMKIAVLKEQFYPSPEYKFDEVCEIAHEIDEEYFATHSQHTEYGIKIVHQ